MMYFWCLTFLEDNMKKSENIIKKSTPLLEQIQNPFAKNHIEANIDTVNAQIYDRSLSWLGRCTLSYYENT